MKKLILILAVLGLLAGPVFGAPQEPRISLDSSGSTVIWYVEGFEYGAAQVTVTGPRKIAFDKTYDRSDEPIFKAVDSSGEPIDGVYTWNLMVRSYLDPELLEDIAKARYLGNEEFVCDLEEEGIIQSFNFSGTFHQVNGKVVLPTNETEKSAGMEKPAGEPTALSSPLGAAEKQVISGNLTVYNSLCVGFDCLANETYGADTIRLKENNLRIHFDDTSTAGSYPNTDWRIIANDQANGGANKFSVEDASRSRTIFTLEAAAPSHSLYVDDGGRVGFGTSTPVVDLHVKEGDSPTLRLEQDTSSGFAAQTWDLAGNETNFFVRDASNGSTLPFRIRPGADSNSIFIDTDNDVGIGTSSPDASMEVERSDKSASLRVTDTNASTGNLNMLYLENNGKITLRTVNNQVGETWDFSNDGNFNISKAGTGVNELSVSDNGNLTIQGSLLANGGADTFPDYVFHDDYPLMPLDKVAAFIDQHGHLPNVPSADDVAAEGYIDMTGLQLKILEKVEELTLYTLSQESTIQTQEQTIQTQEELIQSLTRRLEALEARND